MTLLRLRGSSCCGSTTASMTRWGRCPLSLSYYEFSTRQTITSQINHTRFIMFTKRPRGQNRLELRNCTSEDYTTKCCDGKVGSLWIKLPLTVPLLPGILFSGPVSKLYFQGSSIPASKMNPRLGRACTSAGGMKRGLNADQPFCPSGINTCPVEAISLLYLNIY
jgi:hypothetical protein